MLLKTKQTNTARVEKVSGVGYMASAVVFYYYLPIGTKAPHKFSMITSKFEPMGDIYDAGLNSL